MNTDTIEKKGLMNGGMYDHTAQKFVDNFNLIENPLKETSEYFEMVFINHRIMQITELLEDDEYLWNGDASEINDLKNDLITLLEEKLKLEIKSRRILLKKDNITSGKLKEIIEDEN
jgi:hypothetical protein